METLRGYPKKIDGHGPDQRYSLAKMAIHTGQVKYFEDIFNIIPKTVFCVDVGIRTAAFDACMVDLGKWKLEHIFALAKLLGMPEKKVLDMVMDYRRRQGLQATGEIPG